MSTAIAKRQRAGADIVSFSEPQVQLIKRTICKPRDRDATNDELALFIGQAKRTGLDPFAKQIYAIFRWSGRDKREVMTIQTAIDGFRLIAERTGSYLGKAGTWWCGTDGQWREVWLDDGNPAAAKVIVRKLVAGHEVEIPAVAHWREYASDQGMWKQMPANQLAKCAEALALRQAFPNDLSGLYTPDEMAQAEAPAAHVPRPAEVVSGEIIDSEPPLRASKELVEELQAARKAAGVDDGWLRMQLVAIGVEDVPDRITVTTIRALTPSQGNDLLDALNQAIEERA